LNLFELIADVMSRVLRKLAQSLEKVPDEDNRLQGSNISIWI
jgi:hypothetical protein